MKKGFWANFFAVILFIAISVGVRIYFVEYMITEIQVTDYVNQQQWMAGGNPLDYFTFDLSGCYSLIVSYVMLFFGNKAIVAVYTNVAIQLLSLVFAYSAIKRASNTMISFVCSTILACIPFFLMQVSYIKPIHILNFLIIICIWMLIMIISTVVKSVCGDNEELADELYEENEYMEEEGVEADSFENIQNLKGQQEEKDYQSDDEADEIFEQENDSDSEVEYVENLGGFSAQYMEPLSLSDVELSALSNIDDSVLGTLDQLEAETEPVFLGTDYNELERKKETFLKLDEHIQKAEDKVQKFEDTTDDNREEIVTLTKSEETKLSDEELKENEKASEVFQSEETKRKKTKKTNINYSFVPKRDMMHFDIEDMTDMDYFDIDE